MITTRGLEDVENDPFNTDSDGVIVSELLNHPSSLWIISVASTAAKRFSERLILQANSSS